MSFIEQFDSSILLWLQNLRGPLDSVVTFITRLGDKGYLWIALAVILLLFRKTRRGGFAVLLALVCNLFITNVWLKNAVERVRPYDMIEGLRSLIGEVSSWSFPSGHTSSSFAAAVAVALTFGRKIGVPAIILAVLISLSRLYIGVHYPTDVLAGAVIGTICGIVATLIVKAFMRKKNRR